MANERTGEGLPPETGEARAASKPLNPLSALTLVLVFPARTFERLRERPHWIVPLLFVVGASMLTAIYAAQGGYMDEYLNSMAFRSGTDPETLRAGFLAAGALMAAVGVPLVTLLEALFFALAGTLAGGRASFKAVFSAVAYASVPVGIGSIVFAILMPLTGSAEVGANLAVFLDPTRGALLWSLARQVDLFSIWFFVLLAIAAAPLFRFPVRRARVVGLLFAVSYMLIMGLTGQGSAVRFSDPYADWSVAETAGGSTVHHRASMPRDVVGAASLSCDLAVARAEEVVGSAERIAVYLYPSLDDKRRLTDNRSPAHGVEWANAVHVAWVEGAELALTREVVRVNGAAKLGNVYNPFIRDGLAFYGGGEWGGMTLEAAALEASRNRDLPRLSALLDPRQYPRIDRAVAEPAAGSFVAFLVGERGIEWMRDFYSSAAESDEPAPAILEASLGDSVAAIESSWLRFLEEENQ